MVLFHLRELKMLEVGDRIQLVGIPDHLPMDEAEELELCLGRVFPIIQIDEYGLLMLEIGEVTGQQAFLEIVWIKPEYVEPVV
jgi:hypothetical protein